MSDKPVNKITIRILNSEYNLVGPKSEEEMLKYANHVNDEINKLAKASPSLGLKDLAVLTSLNLADDLFTGAAQIDSLTARVRELEEKIEKNEDRILCEKLKSQVDKLQRSNDEKEEEISKLKSAMDNSSQMENVKLSEYQSIIKELTEKAEVAEALAAEFQNKAYNLELKYTKIKESKEETE